VSKDPEWTIEDEDERESRWLSRNHQPQKNNRTGKPRFRGDRASLAVPNAGKVDDPESHPRPQSLDRLGQKPQTTRNRIVGILNDPARSDRVSSIRPAFTGRCTR